MRHIKFSSVGKQLNPIKLYKTSRIIKYIVVHCTANSNKSPIGAKDIDKEHMHRWGPKSGCGYHYVVKVDGTLEKGRWADYAGAHVKGYNSNSIAVAYVGGLNSKGFATDDILNMDQRRTLLLTIKELARLYPDAEILGHKEFPGVNKACPCMNMTIVRRQVKGRLF